MTFATPRDFCCWLLGPYVERGDTDDRIRSYSLGYMDDDHDVSTWTPGRFTVARLNGNECGQCVRYKDVLRRLRARTVQLDLFANSELGG